MIMLALKYWQLILGGLGCLALGILLMVQKGETRHWKKMSEQNFARYQAEHNAFASTVNSYRLTAIKAREDDTKNIERVRNELAKNNSESLNAYQIRLAAARDELARLRANTKAGANSSGGATTPVSSIPTPTCGTDAPTDDPITRAFTCAIQLDELIKAVSKNSEIEINGNK